MSGVLTSNGLVIRLMFTRLFGARVHVFDGDDELIICPQSLKALSGGVSPEVEKEAVGWVRRHQHEVLLMWRKFGTAA